MSMQINTSAAALDAYRHAAVPATGTSATGGTGASAHALARPATDQVTFSATGTAALPDSTLTADAAAEMTQLAVAQILADPVAALAAQAGSAADATLKLLH